MTELEALRVDWSANRGYPKARLILVLFRVGRHLRSSGPVGAILAVPIRLTYLLLVEWLFTVELPWGVDTGAGIRLEHPMGVVIHPRVRLGDAVTIKQHVTLGVRWDASRDDSAPTIGSHAILGSGCQVLGPVTVGAGAQVGAGAVVLRDVPAQATAVGVPARILHRPSSTAT